MAKLVALEVVGAFELVVVGVGVGFGFDLGLNARLDILQIDLV